MEVGYNDYTTTEVGSKIAEVSAKLSDTYYLSNGLKAIVDEFEKYLKPSNHNDDIIVAGLIGKIVGYSVSRDAFLPREYDAIWSLFEFMKSVALLERISSTEKISTIMKIFSFKKRAVGNNVVRVKEDVSKIV